MSEKDLEIVRNGKIKASDLKDHHLRAILYLEKLKLYTLFKDTRVQFVHSCWNETIGHIYT